MENVTFTPEENEILGRLFPGDLLRKFVAAITSAISGALVEKTLKQICSGLEVENIGQIRSEMATIKKVAETPAAIDVNSLTETLKQRLLTDRDFMVGLAKVQREGREAAAEYKKQVIAEILSEQLEIPAENLSYELIESLWSDRVTTGAPAAWPAHIADNLKKRREVMEETLTGLLLQKNADTNISSEAKMLVVLGVPSDNSKTIRAALEENELDLLSKLKKS